MAVYFKTVGLNSAKWLARRGVSFSPSFLDGSNFRKLIVVTEVSKEVQNHLYLHVFLLYTILGLPSS